MSRRVLRPRWANEHDDASSILKGEASLIRFLGRSILAALALATLPVAAVAAPPSSDPSAPNDSPTKQLNFAIMRKGAQIGQYQISIFDNGNTKTIDFSTDIKVNVLMFTAYHLHHTGQEVWTDGHFVSYVAQTDDNGKQRSVSLTSGADGETLVVDGESSQLPKGILPATFWNANFLDAKKLIDPDNGKEISVKVEDAGDDPVVMNGSPETAHHYHIGGLGRDVWMMNGLPVRFQLKGSDNSTVVSELEPSTPATP
jgi:hypothetical protein